MKWKRLIRSALALVLVCCLIINIATIPVRASALLETLWILGENVMFGLLRALGIKGGESANDLYVSAQEAWAAY